MISSAASEPFVVHAIQQAVAPAFLLTAIGSFLSVLSVRLSRVVDRFRVLKEQVDTEANPLYDEMALLSRRARWIHLAISHFTVCAVLICAVIAALFVGAEFQMDPARTVAVLFILAMLALLMGLLSFLREISLSTGVIEMDRQRP